MLDCPFFVLKFSSSSLSSFEIIKTMTKTPNHRNKVQAKTAKKKPSKKHRCNHTHKFWRNKALRSQGIFDQIRNLNKEVEEIKEEKEKEKEEKEEIAAQLEVARREISQAEARCQVLIRRAKRNRNNAMRRNSERWQQRERELKEKHEQERSEWMEEVERHETGYREAMRRLRELEGEIETTYKELFEN